MLLSVASTIYFVLIVMAIFLLIYLLFLFILLVGIDQYFLNIRLGDRPIKPIDYDFYKGLKKDEFSFLSKKNKLIGGIYYYNQKSDNIAIMVHGYGANHKNYFAEINYLASLGYTVYSYDGTGTSLSEGKKFGGAPQAIKDLECCIKEVKKLNPNASILLFGHSMGAYAVCNVLNVEHVNKVVAVAPFDNMPDIIFDGVMEKFGKRLFLLRPMYKLIQRVKFGKYSGFTTYKTLSKTQTPVLVIHGVNDRTVSINHFLENMDTNQNPNVKFMMVEDKLHRPLQSDNAVAYNEYLKLQLDSLKVKNKNKLTDEMIEEFNKGIDRQLKNELDEKVLSKITEFLREN